MTCAEFWEVIDKSQPKDCTNATLIAVGIHGRECAACYDKLTQRNANSRKQLGLTKEEEAVVDLMIHLQELPNKLRILNDPYYREALEESDRKRKEQQG